MNQDLNSSSLSYIEELYSEYLRDPNSVSTQWQEYFRQYDYDIANSQNDSFSANFTASSIFNPPTKPEQSSQSATDLQYKIGMLIRNFRTRGHIMAQLDPLGLVKNESPRELSLEHYGFDETDLERIVESGSMSGYSLKQVYERLKETYCRSIGVQFMHIDDYDVRDWLQKRMENSLNRLELNHEQQLRILGKLTEAVVFEEFLQKKYVGVKSFSLTGSESLIPLLDLAIEQAAAQGVTEVVLGMAHRGRLNVLSNIIKKPTRQIFREFDDADASAYIGRGDVKYHLGYSQDIISQVGTTVHMSLSFNPSHLEFITPVANGRVRAKQDRLKDKKREKVLSIAIHGDAAFIGEGVVQETLNLSELEAYTISGTLHVVLNNQIGFTTTPEQSRSSVYATDIAKMLQSPIFHVNGEDPEAVAQVVKLAMDFRHKFKRDVVIDVYGYRKFGHNESDEPAFTQPLMYDVIRKRKSVRQGYLDHLLSQSDISREEADEIKAAKIAELELELESARAKDYKISYQAYEGEWKGYKGGDDADCKEVKTAVPAKRLKELLLKLSQTPKDFTPNSKIRRLLDAKEKMAAGKVPLDWSAAEALAFATISTDGYRIRMTGQDAERGTFSHRHAVLHDRNTDKRYMPLAHLSPNQAEIEIKNSPLSETAVLGFEFGYSLDWPDGLTIWEAQFGDFANAGQVIIDQFISSTEDKWRRLSGLVLLLPHGFEGQGPEHSSARLERFLVLAAEDNMQIMNLTTPAQIFHVLRRQVIRKWRKPLIIMSPMKKSPSLLLKSKLIPLWLKK